MPITTGDWTYEMEGDGDNFKLLSRNGEVIIEGCGCCESPQISGKDDARAIAAVPKMLAQLKAYINVIAAYGSHPNDVADLLRINREAIMLVSEIEGTAEANHEAIKEFLPSTIV